MKGVGPNGWGQCPQLCSRVSQTDQSGWYHLCVGGKRAVGSGEQHWEMAAGVVYRRTGVISYRGVNYMALVTVLPQQVRDATLQDL
jgi:hypothetical protein